MPADAGAEPKTDGGEALAPRAGRTGADAGQLVPVGTRSSAPSAQDEQSAGGGTGGGSARPTSSYSGSCHVPGGAQLEDVSNATTTIGNGTPGSCSGDAFVAAVAKGGVITFDCGANPHTIVLNRTANVLNSTRKLVIDGGGKVTLSGGGRVRILYQNTCDSALGGYATDKCDNQSFPELTVQNLTLVDGNARSAHQGDGGGAIFASGGRLKILNSHFYNNACADQGADAGGGAVRTFQQYNNQPVYIVNSTFGAPGRGNSGSNGGALSTIGVSFELIGSTLTHNRATGHGANPARAGTPGGGSGGAIYTDGTTYSLRLCDTTIANNQASEGGGGVFFVSNDNTGHFSIEGSRLYSNTGGTFDNHPGMFVKNNGDSPSIASSDVR